MTAKLTYPNNIQPTDNLKSRSLKMYKYLSTESDFKELFTPTTFMIYEHIRINSKQDKEEHVFNTTHRFLADALKLNDRVVKHHLNILCLVGILRRKVQGYGNYWFNYYLTNINEQTLIQNQNSTMIITQLTKQNVKKVSDKKGRDTMKSLKLEIIELKAKIKELEESVFELRMERQERLFRLKEEEQGW